MSARPSSAPSRRRAAPSTFFVASGAALVIAACDGGTASPSTDDAGVVRPGEPGQDGGDPAASTDGATGVPIPEAGAAGCVVLGPHVFKAASTTATEVALGIEVVLRSQVGGETLEILVYRGPPEGFVPGTYDISCKQFCHLSLSTASKSYVATSGAVTISSIVSPVEFQGSISNIELRPRVTLTTSDGGLETTFDPNGACAMLEATALDTRAPIGSACAVEEDCGAGATKVCDPSTRTCSAPQCTSSQPTCPGSQVCVLRTSGVGACYATCRVSSPGSCPSGFQCRRFGMKEICSAVGSGGPGATCARVSTVGSRCIAGYECGDAGCTPACDRYAINQGCAAGQRCLFSDVDGMDRCGTPKAPYLANVAIGAVCPGSGISAFTRQCGDDGTALRGACVYDFATNETTCRQLCDPSAPTPCPAGLSCTSPGTGIYTCE